MKALMMISGRNWPWLAWAAVLAATFARPATVLISWMKEIGRGEKDAEIMTVAVLHFLLCTHQDTIRARPKQPAVGIELEAFPAAVIALSNLAACFICEIVASGILAVSSGQREAATASGLSAYQQLRYIILPQAMRTILPPLVGQYVLLIKDSSVVSAIGVVDVTRVGWLTVQRIPEGIMVFGLVGILYFVICYPLINLSNMLERRMTVVATRL